MPTDQSDIIAYYINPAAIPDGTVTLDKLDPNSIQTSAVVSGVNSGRLVSVACLYNTVEEWADAFASL